jgi:hypothetical protein
MSTGHSNSFKSILLRPGLHRAIADFAMTGPTTSLMITESSLTVYTIWSASHFPVLFQRFIRCMRSRNTANCTSIPMSKYAQAVLELAATSHKTFAGQ